MIKNVSKNRDLSCYLPFWAELVIASATLLFAACVGTNLFGSLMISDLMFSVGFSAAVSLGVWSFTWIILAFIVAGILCALGKKPYRCDEYTG